MRSVKKWKKFWLKQLMQGSSIITEHIPSVVNNKRLYDEATPMKKTATVNNTVNPGSGVGLSAYFAKKSPMGD